MKYKKAFLVFGIILSFLSTSVHISANLEELSPEKDNYSISETTSLQTSDIAGSDLYAERIDAFVAGNKSIIKQSLFTNDTSILSRFDTRDPAFYKCNILFSASNGITPDIFPRILHEGDHNNQYEMSFNAFSGFLYYDEKLDALDVGIRAKRALEIIQRKFEIDLIPVESKNPYFFPFVGHYPDWEIYFREVTTNLPMDGYWKALNIERLISEGYFMNHHLSSTFLSVNSLDFLKFNVTKMTDQVNFNIESLNLAYLEDLNVDNIFEQLSNILADYESLFGNASEIISNETSQGAFNEFGGVFSGLNLSNESHYTSFMIQYEGMSEGIKQISSNEYTFNLWDALGYEGAPLKPSNKIYISLLGAFMSEIDITIFSTEIIDQTPNHFTLYEDLIEQIGLLLYYAQIDFDIQTLNDYSFELFWVDEAGFKRSHITPVNLNDQTDVVNYLHLFGFQGFPGIPTGIFNPIHTFEVTYKTSNSEPNLLITKDLIGGNASNGIYNDFSFNITAKNIGNETAWGVPTPIPISLDDIFTIIVGPVGAVLGLDQDLKDAIWTVVRVEYAGQYSSLDDFFNFDKDPLIFYFDTTGAGTIDTYFPNLNNLTNIFPYNENMDHVIDLIQSGNPQLIASLIAVGVTPSSLKSTFTNENSVWNSDNWFLEPNEILSYTYDNFSIGDIDSFTPFYRYNFTLKDTFPNLPALLTGTSIEETTPQMALFQDNLNWIIESEQTYVDQYDLEIQFLFQNDTRIDLYNNSLDSVSILINYTDPNNVLNFEVFNYSSEEFQDLVPYQSDVTNNSRSFTFIKNRGTLEWLFDPSTRINHTILVRLKGSSSNAFNISINDFDVEFLYRDVNEYLVLGSRVIYRSASGLVEYVRTSNSISLSTINMASIVAYARLDKYNSYAGEINNYSLVIKNIGSSFARNINISLAIPGIIYDPINFTIENESLKYKLAELPATAESKLKFSFFVPNSIIISNVTINYSNDEIVKSINSTTLKSHPNEVYVVAPVDYLDRFPFIKTIEISYNSSNLAPLINDELNLTISVKNTGPEGLNIQNITFSMSDQFGSLIPLNTSPLSIPLIMYNTSEILTLNLKKIEWRGYYYAPINFFNAPEQNTVQIVSSKPIVMGYFNFLITKSVDKNQIEIEDVISVNITVVNIGNICAKNVTLNDATSFTGIEFSLISGSLIYTIPTIHPGEKVTFFYKIQAIRQTLVALKPAVIEYYYLVEKKAISNTIVIKIAIPKLIMISFVLGPALASLIALFIFIWQTRRYKARKYELQRNELTLFKVSKSDAVLKVENTLRDRLNLISKGKKPIKNEDNKGGNTKN